jgi:hypothetical protein
MKLLLFSVYCTSFQLMLPVNYAQAMFFLEVILVSNTSVSVFALYTWAVNLTLVSERVHSGTLRNCSLCDGEWKKVKAKSCEYEYLRCLNWDPDYVVAKFLEWRSSLKSTCWLFLLSHYLTRPGTISCVINAQKLVTLILRKTTCLKMFEYSTSSNVRCWAMERAIDVAVTFTKWHEVGALQHSTIIGTHATDWNRRKKD